MTTYTVTNTIDGDTFDVAGGHRIRIWGIDAPDTGEYGKQESTANLDKLIGGVDVILKDPPYHPPTLDSQGREENQRYVKQVFLKSLDIGGEQIRSKHAKEWLKFSGGYYSR